MKKMLVVMLVQKGNGEVEVGGTALGLVGGRKLGIEKVSIRLA